MDSTKDPAENGKCHTTYDRARDGSLTYTIVEAVATVKDAEPTDLEPLQTAVDADALEGLVSSLGRSASLDGKWRTEFTFEGCHVEVTSSGDVTVSPQSIGRRRATVSTEEEFEVALAQLVREAEANGVAVDGGWACRGGSTYPTWGIEIYEVDESEQR